MALGRLCAYSSSFCSSCCMGPPSCWQAWHLWQCGYLSTQRASIFCMLPRWACWWDGAPRCWPHMKPLYLISTMPGQHCEFRNKWGYAPT